VGSSSKSGESLARIDKVVPQKRSIKKGPIAAGGASDRWRIEVLLKVKGSLASKVTE
jgi:hypothetical protein